MIRGRLKKLERLVAEAVANRVTRARLRDLLKLLCRRSRPAAFTNRHEIRNPLHECLRRAASGCCTRMGQHGPAVKEFHCIMPIANIGSVLKHGILSNERAGSFRTDSVALQAVQDKRHEKQVPGGLRFHQYANLYFHARNPMMYRRKGQADDLCVLRISLDVLKVRGVVLADCNAGSEYVRFLAPSQWKLLDFDDIFARLAAPRGPNPSMAPRGSQVRRSFGAERRRGTPARRGLRCESATKF